MNKEPVTAAHPTQNRKSPPAALAKLALRARGWLDVAIQKTFPPPVALMEIITGQWVAQAVLVAAELGVAEALIDGPQAISELAKVCNANEDGLYRLLRLLACKGIFRETKPRVFAMTKLAKPLLREAPDSVFGMCEMVSADFHHQAWRDLKVSVQTGRSAIEVRHGENLFEHLEKNPEASRAFNNGMTGWASQSVFAIADAVNFAGYPVLIDVGGGRGRFLTALLNKFPRAQGRLFDQEHVVRDVKVPNAVAPRFDVVSGSFFETIPTGGDAYFLKNILHDWDDKVSRGILERIRNAMKPESRLFIIESVVPEGNDFHPGKLIDLEMLVCTPGGKERTANEFRDLLSSAGLELLAIHPTAAIESVIEVARPAAN